MSTQIVRPARTLQGSLTVPGDKSISHRYALLAGLAEGTTRLSNFSTGADPHASLACMEALGATVAKTGSGPAAIIEVTGVAGHFRQPSAPLDCGNSGSTMRMLAGLVARQPLHWSQWRRQHQFHALRCHYRKRGSPPSIFYLEL